MGYTTTFEGSFKLDRALNPEHRAYLLRFSELLPSVIAECVTRIPYEGQELSSPPSNVREVEALRKAMTPEQVKEFSELADQRCRRAFDAGADWFVKLAKSKSNRGRDQSYVWLTHWLVSYLLHPESFRRDGAS